jgi:hypothetical protein
MKHKIKSRWVVKSDDSRYIINREVDGGLILLDCAVLEPNDPDSREGLFYVAPEDVHSFLTAMKAGLALDAKMEAAAHGKAKPEKSK